MDCIRKKVDEEIARGWIGPNKSCPYHPSHFKGQDCTFCYCPFFPCNDPILGTEVVGRHGSVWDCSPCLFMHRTEVARFVMDEIRRMGITDATDPRLRELFKVTKERFWHRGKALMVVGTSSNAGKTLSVTALCRILHDRGLLVTPYKSQNMSLNSRVTRFGTEIALAQHLQAKAAGLTCPDSRINPILLKPKGGITTQVTVMGSPLAEYDMHDYYGSFVDGRGKEIVKETLDYLRDRYDVVVMEGAGSAAEFNLYDRDIANMRAAEIADASVILIVNVELGGSYAAVLGTLELMPPEDRSRVKGVIFNNLRGAKDFMQDSMEEFEKRIGIPVLGIVPHFDIPLPAEDSEALAGLRSKGDGKTRIAVVRFPYISDFTDFDPLLLEDVTLVLASTPADLTDADAVILPGTGNTVKDLSWLSESGFADALKDLKGKVPILGICGGYQIMGATVDDPEGLEGGIPGSYDGLGFFDMSTSFKGGRTASLNTGALASGDGAISGFEVHSGESDVNEEPLFMIDRFGSKPMPEGAYRPEEKLFGTYQHGIFDRPAFRRMFLSACGCGCSDTDYDEIVEENIDRLAKVFEENVDIDRMISMIR